MEQRFNLFSKLNASIVLFLSMISSAFAAMINPFESLQDIMGYVFEFGSLSWIDASQRVYAVKFIYFIVIIVLIEYFLRHPREIIADKKVRGIIAFAVAAIATLFIPADLAEIAGGQYGMLFGFILAGSLPGLLIWQGWKAIKDDPDTAGKKWKQVFILFLGIILLLTIGGLFGLSGHDGNFVSSASSMIMAGLGIAFFIYLISAVMKTFGHKIAGGEVAQAGGDIQNSINKASSAIGEAAGRANSAYDEAMRKRKRELKDERKEVTTLKSINHQLDNVAKDLLKYNQDETLENKGKDIKHLKATLQHASKRFSKLTKLEVDETQAEKERETNEDKNRNLEGKVEIEDEQKRKKTMKEESLEIKKLQQILTELFAEINGYLENGDSTIGQVTQSLHAAKEEIQKLIKIIKIEEAENKKKEL